MILELFKTYDNVSRVCDIVDVPDYYIYIGMAVKKSIDIYMYCKYIKDRGVVWKGLCHKGADNWYQYEYLKYVKHRPQIVRALENNPKFTNDWLSMWDYYKHEWRRV